VVVIFQENVSFDHYFASYPTAMNPGGEPFFEAQDDHADVNGLTGVLLSNNPNFNTRPTNPRDQSLPSRPQPGFHMRPGSQYGHEQQAFDEG